jgi:isoleucyl-tRNA synthetase
MRRSAQTALHEIYGTLVKLIAPILVFTADEAWRVYPAGEGKSVHESSWPSAVLEGEEEVVADWDVIRELRNGITPFLEVLREAKAISANLEAQVKIFSPDPDLQALLKKYANDFARVFVVSRVLVANETWVGAGVAKVDFKNGGRIADLHVEIAHAGGKKCVRCWTYHEELGKSPEHPEICERCTEAIEGLSTEPK